MAVRRETSEVDVVINGDAGRKTLHQINQEVRSLTNSLYRMNEADNPQLYQQRLAALRELRDRQRELRDEIHSSGEEQKGFFKQFFSGYSDIKKLVSGVTLGSLIAGGITAGLGALKSLVSSMITTYTTFERFDAVLTNTLGDKGSSRRALNALQKFAAETPFELAELTDGYVKFVNRGITPTMAEMTKMGDLAASQGKSFDQLTEAILDAVTGEFERLKEFGIRASKNGDTVRLSFKGITTEVKNTDEAIKNAILSFGAMDGVAGGMQKMSETLGGQLSNLSDNWDRVLTGMGKRTGGFMFWVTQHTNQFLDNLVESFKTTEEKLNEHADNYAAESMTRFTSRTDAEQKQFIEETRLEVEALKKELERKEKQPKKSVGMAKNEDPVNKEIDLLKIRVAEEQAVLDAALEQRRNKEKAEAQRKRDEALRLADEQKKEAEAARKKAEQEEKQAIARAKTAYKQLLQQSKELSAESLTEEMSKNEKEVAETKRKFDKVIEKEREFLHTKGTTKEQRIKIEADIANLTVQKGEAVKKLRIRQETELMDKIKDLRRGLQNVYTTELQRETDQINKFYDNEIKNAETAEARKRLEADRAKDLADAKIREEVRFQDVVDEIRQEGLVANATADELELARINKKYDDQIEALKKKFGMEKDLTAEQQAAIDLINGNRKGEIERADEKKRQDEQKKYKDAAIDAAQATTNAIFEIGRSNRAAELDQQLSALDAQRERELNNKNLTEEQKKAINDKYDKQAKEIKLAAWKADKEAALQSAIINGALAVVKALPNPFAAAAAGVAAAAQVAVIAATKPPKYSKGGMIPAGPDHSAGGIDLVNTQTGMTIGNMEGGEPIMILSKETRRNNGPLINELLHNSQYRNGATVRVDTGMAMKAMRYDHGGMLASARVQEIGQSRSAPADAPGTAGFATGDKLDQLIDETRATRKAIKDQKVILSRRVWDEEEARQVQISNEVNG